jgi:hypothetical protein
MKLLKMFFYVVVLLLSTQTSASADVAIGSIAFFEPAMFFLIIPVIILESMVMMKSLKNVKWHEIVEAVFMSNIFSMFIGYPIAWIFMAVIQLNIPDSGGGSGLSHFLWSIVYFLEEISPCVLLDTENIWAIPMGFIFLQIPFFFVSCWIEFPICARCMKTLDVSRAEIKSAVWKGNIISYFFLITVCTIICSYSR